MNFHQNEASGYFIHNQNIYLNKQFCVCYFELCVSSNIRDITQFLVRLNLRRNLQLINGISNDRQKLLK